MFEQINNYSAFIRCDSNDDSIEDIIEEYPSLKLVNQLNDSWQSIVEVSLVGYEFDNLNIEPYGGSQTFVLDEGMPGHKKTKRLPTMYKRH